MSDKRGEAFERALDEARRNDRDSNDEGSSGARRPRLRATVALGRAPGSAGKARFGLALDWTDEATDRPATPPRPLPREAAQCQSDTPAEIAAELGLGVALTLTQLTSRWREFVWRNHPDRQPLEARAQANARVAIANALYEGARQKLAQAR